MLRRNGPVVKSVESVLRLEGSLWGERFVEEVERVLPRTGSSWYSTWFSFSWDGWKEHRRRRRSVLSPTTDQ